MVSRPVVLVAASGLAREVMAAMASAGLDQPIAVLDDDPALAGTSVGGTPIAGGIDAVAQFPEAELLICAGSGAARRSIAHRLADRGIGPERYARVVHPGASLPPGCDIGPGSIVLGGVVATADVRVGAHVVLMPAAVLTHDCVVDDFATVCAGVALGGGVRVGEAAYLGMNASVRQHLTVGAGSVLGMGAVLLQDLPAGATWFGVPAHPAAGEPARRAPDELARPTPDEPARRAPDEHGHLIDIADRLPTSSLDRRRTTRNGR